MHRLTGTAEALDADAAVRGAGLAKNCPAAISSTVGATPTDPQAATAWEQAAGRLEQFHASFGTTQGLGPDSYSHPGDFADSRQRAKQALNTLIAEHERLNPAQLLTQDQGLGISR
jgi:hypothetical protein